MIRKAIIMILTTLATITLTVGVLSLWVEWGRVRPLTPHHLITFYARSFHFYVVLVTSDDNRVISGSEDSFRYLPLNKWTYMIGPDFGPDSRPSGVSGSFQVTWRQRGVMNPGIWGSTFHITSLTSSFWLPVLAAVLYPTIAFIRGPLRRYRRRKKGLCLECGYDLTGNVTGVCSEYGQDILQREA